jgi:hypothetical protein
MLLWCAVLFGLGVLAFVDSVFNMGEIFRQINSLLFMLISLALLIRTTTKARAARLEKYQDVIFNLEKRVQSLEASQKALNEF